MVIVGQKYFITDLMLLNDYSHPHSRCEPAYQTTLGNDKELISLLFVTVRDEEVRLKSLAVCKASLPSVFIPSVTLSYVASQ